MADQEDFPKISAQETASAPDAIGYADLIGWTLNVDVHPGQIDAEPAVGDGPIGFIKGELGGEGAYEVSLVPQPADRAKEAWLRMNRLAEIEGTEQVVSSYRLLLGCKTDAQFVPQDEAAVLSSFEVFTTRSDELNRLTTDLVGKLPESDKSQLLFGLLYRQSLTEASETYGKGVLESGLAQEGNDISIIFHTVPDVQGRPVRVPKKGAAMDRPATGNSLYDLAFDAKLYEHTTVYAHGVAGKTKIAAYETLVADDEDPRFVQGYVLEQEQDDGGRRLRVLKEDEAPQLFTYTLNPEEGGANDGATLYEVFDAEVEGLDRHAERTLWKDEVQEAAVESYDSRHESGRKAGRLVAIGAGLGLAAVALFGLFGRQPSSSANENSRGTQAAALGLSAVPGTDVASRITVSPPTEGQPVRTTTPASNETTVPPTTAKPTTTSTTAQKVTSAPEMARANSPLPSEREAQNEVIAYMTGNNMQDFMYKDANGNPDPSYISIEDGQRIGVNVTDKYVKSSEAIFCTEWLYFDWNNPGLIYEATDSDGKTTQERLTSADQLMAKMDARRAANDPSYCFKR